MDDDSLIEELILKGGLEFAGIDDQGQPLYNLTSEIKEIMPELYEEHLNYINKEVMNLWEKGFVDIDLLNNDPLISLTKKAFSDEDINLLTKEEQRSILEIRRVLSK